MRFGKILAVLAIIVLGFIGFTNAGAQEEPVVLDWDAIARCRSGGNWSHPPIPMNMSGILYSGGLMLPLVTWKEYGGTQYRPLPHQATKAQQIQVGRAIVADPATGGAEFAQMLAECEGDMTRQGPTDADN